MQDESAPTERRQDIAQALIRAGVSLVPGGGAINELLNLVIVPAAAERQRRWLEALDHDLSKLRGRVDGFSLGDLHRREDFTSSFLRAWRIAATTHREEKLEALRNAAPERSDRRCPRRRHQALFFSLIDAYTPWHLRILAFLDDPDQWTRAHERKAFKELRNSMRGIAFNLAIKCVFPDLEGRASVAARVERDLEFDGLVPREGGFRHFTGAVERMLNGVSIEGWNNEVLTAHGRVFLRFVSTPSSTTK